MKLSERVTRIYRDASHPAGFSDDMTIARHLSEPASKVRPILETLDSYTRTRQARQNFKRRKIRAYTILEVVQVDLMDLQKYAHQNKGYRYILIVTDTLSKRLWLVPLKSKTAKEVAAAFVRGFLNRADRPPKFMLSDDGKEFTNKLMQQIYSEYGIVRYKTLSGKPVPIAPQAERCIRYIRGQLTKIFIDRQSLVWINLLSQLEKSYNQRPHSSIGGLSPNQVTSKNEHSVFQHLYRDTPVVQKPSFQAGDKVRIAKQTGIFSKRSHDLFSREVFLIDKVKNTRPITYLLRDQSGESILGGFYAAELSRVRL